MANLTRRTGVRCGAGGGEAGLAGAFVGTFLLVLSNPATILSFIAVFATLAGRAGGVALPQTMIAGVLAGSARWWLLLSSAVGALRQRFDARAQRLVNRVSALGLAAFALWQWLGGCGRHRPVAAPAQRRSTTLSYRSSARPSGS